jgi:hypothetical protein
MEDRGLGKVERENGPRRRASGWGLMNATPSEALQLLLQNRIGLWRLHGKT